MRIFTITPQKASAISRKEGFTLPKKNALEDRLLCTGAKLYNVKGKYIVSSYAYDDRDALPYLTGTAVCPLLKFLEGLV